MTLGSLLGPGGKNSQTQGWAGQENVVSFLTVWDEL